MDRIKALVLTFSAAFLLFQPGVEGQIQPSSSYPPPRPLCVSQLALVNYACGRVVPVLAQPLSPPSATIFPERNRHHRHRHGHEAHSETPAEADCCKWLNNVDDQCVCDLLVRLPTFLAKHVHEYTVIVDDGCRVTYRCGGKIKP